MTDKIASGTFVVPHALVVHGASSQRGSSLSSIPTECPSGKPHPAPNLSVSSRDDTKIFFDLQCFYSAIYHPPMPPLVELPIRAAVVAVTSRRPSFAMNRATTAFEVG